MSLAGWRAAGREIAVIGLARSGEAAATLLRREGIPVYASDIGEGAALRATAERLHAIGADVQVGGHDLDRIRRTGGLVISPGIPPAAPVVAAARHAGVEVRAEADLGLEALAGIPCLAVTGTNGKSTTTALAAHLLVAGGFRAAAVGNIGTPVCEAALWAERPEWLSVELSSFQLHDCHVHRPAIGIVTNLSPDHLDRYVSLEEYYGDKRRLFLNASTASTWVVDPDDGEVQRLIEGTPGRRVAVSMRGTADAWFDRDAGVLRLHDAPLLPRHEFGLLGDHNVANALMAAAAVFAAGIGLERLAAGLRTFRPLDHRLEPVAELAGVLWINDSKATNIASTAMAVRAMERPFVLLLGGRHKGEPYTSLAPLLGRCRGVVAYGEAEDLIVRDLGAAVRVQRAGSDWHDVVAVARDLTRPGDAVLLSPACSSFDMFQNYGERGDRFREAVMSG